MCRYEYPFYLGSDWNKDYEYDYPNVFKLVQMKDPLSQEKVNVGIA